MTDVAAHVCRLSFDIPEAAAPRRLSSAAQAEHTDPHHPQDLTHPHLPPSSRVSQHRSAAGRMQRGNGAVTTPGPRSASASSALSVSSLSL